MSIVTINKSKTDQFPYYYKDRADFKVWSFGTVVKYDWTVRPNGQADKLTSTQTRSQPTDWNYRFRIRNHLNATTNLTGTKYRLESSGDSNYILISYQAVDPGDGVTWRNMYWELRGMVTPTRGPPPDPGSISLANADRDAKLRFLKQVRKNYESFQGLTFLGELAETVHMLRHPLQGLGRGFMDYLRTVTKRANRSTLPSLNRMITSTWLEKTYGWAPLINDIESIGQTMDDITNRYMDSFERCVGVGEEVFSPSNWSGWNYQNACWTINLQDRTQMKSVVRYYGQAFRAALLATDLRTRTQNLGLGLRSFLPTAWELIPYSFVADYFTNTGNLIEAATTNTSGVKWTSRDYIKVGTRTTRYAGVSRNTSLQPDAKTRNVRVTAIAVDHSIERRYIERSWLTEPPIVGLRDFQWKVPGVGSTQWINLAALAAQQKASQDFLKKLVMKGR